MEIKGDFLGFTFAGVRSEEFGFVRVSGGDRYNEQLQSDVKDITAEVPGMDGEYYFGSTYSPKQIDIEIAFDSMTEEQFRKMRKVFGRKKQGELIFDERPYKKYMAKIESPIELSYICFDEPMRQKYSEVNTILNPATDLPDGIRVIERETHTEIIDDEEVTITSITREKIDPWVVDYTQTQRIYKGEGKISFICYFPFAKSTFKVLPQLGNKYYEGSQDWAVSSGILSQETREGLGIDTYNEGIIRIYNAGDLPTGFRLYCPFSAAESSNEETEGPVDAQTSTAGAQSTYNLTLTYKANANDSTEPAVLQIQNLEPKDNDVGFLINTDNGLIQGVQSYGTNLEGASYIVSNNLYNQYITAGYFFKLEPNDAVGDEASITVTDGNDGIEIFYDYLYF